MCVFQLYNGTLRRFGNCGEVEDGVAPVLIAERCEKFDNFWSSTIHALVSAIKKLQTPDRGWLYRGLSGGQLPSSFCQKGFAEWAFMSTTKDLQVAAYLLNL